MKLAARLEGLRVRVALRSLSVPPLAGASVVTTRAGAVQMLSRGTSASTVFLPADPPLGLEHYLPAIERLTRRYRVVACELPGFGFSPPHPEFDWSMESYAGVFEDVLDHAGVSAVILVPTCFAGLPALRFALDRPARVRGFVGVQTPNWTDARSWMKRNDPSGLFSVPVAGQLVNWAASQWLEKLWLDIAEPDPAQRAQFETIRRDRVARGCLYCLASGLQATLRPDPFEGVRLDVPSALLWGLRDRSHRPTSPRSFGAYLPLSRLFEVPEAGHFPELTAPETLLAAVDHVAAM